MSLNALTPSSSVPADHVDPEEAALSGGMIEDPSRSTAETEVRDLLVRATRESLLLLAHSITSENSMRVLTQLGKTALAHRKTLTLYGDFQLDEELETQNKPKKHNGTNTGGPLAALGLGGLEGLNRETGAVHLLRELVASYQQNQRMEQVGNLLTAAEKLRALGEDERAGKLEAKAKRLTDSALSQGKSVDPEPPSTEVIVAALPFLTEGQSPDQREHLDTHTVPFSDASGANVWTANLGDAMNGDTGTAPHPDDYASSESSGNTDYEPDAPGYNVPVPMDI